MEYVKHLNLFGVEAKEIPCITGMSTPVAATAGAVGCLYMNTITGEIYKCVAAADGVYTWEPVGGEGYTPVKGVDYYTEEEQQEIVAQAAAAVAAHRYALSYESPLSFGATNESDLTAIVTALPDNASVVFWINNLAFPAVFAEIAEQAGKIGIASPYGIVTITKFANVACVKWEHYMTLDTLVNRYSIVNGVGWTGWADATALAAAEGVEF